MAASGVGQMVGSLETGAMGLLHDAQLDYYGKRVAAAAANNTVAVWDITDGQQRPAGTLSGHEGPIWKVSWAHPKFGSLLATSSYDMKIIVWKEVPAMSGHWQIAYMDSSHSASVNDVQFCPWEFGLRLACASSDGTVSVLTYGADQQWYRTSFQAHAGGANTVSWMPAHRRTVSDVSAPAMRLVTGGCDAAVSIWKCDGENWTQEMPPLPPVHSDWVRAVAWRPDSEASVVASGSWDKTIVIWTQEMEGQPWRQACKLDAGGKVESLSWSVTGGLLAASVGSEGEAVLFKEAQDGRYEKVGEVAESGYTEVTSSIFGFGGPPPNPSMSAPSVDFGQSPAVQQPPPVAAAAAEAAQQQQSVMDAFGM